MVVVWASYILHYALILVVVCAICITSYILLNFAFYNAFYILQYILHYASCSCNLIVKFGFQKLWHFCFINYFSCCMSVLHFTSCINFGWCKYILHYALILVVVCVICITSYTLLNFSFYNAFYILQYILHYASSSCNLIVKFGCLRNYDILVL